MLHYFAAYACKLNWPVIRGFIFFPLFNIGTTFAVYQSCGTVDVSNDLLKMSANSSARIFAKLCGILRTILSGPGAF